MNAVDTEPLAHILQFSISPVVLISAVGLLLLTMANRFGRAIDRSRELGGEIERAQASERPALQEQLRILLVRAHWLQKAITLIGASLFFSCVLIFLMFTKIIANWPATGVIVGVFCLDVLALLLAIVYFLRELFQALAALEIEVAPRLN